LWQEADAVFQRAKDSMDLLRRSNGRLPEIDRCDDHALEIVGEIATVVLDASHEKASGRNENECETDLHRQQ
jgi:hypothetical protein